MKVKHHRSPDIGRLALGLILVVALSESCAPSLKRISLPSGAVAEEARIQRELSLSALVAHQDRLARVHYRIVRSAGELCPRRRAAFGIALHDITMYAPEDRDLAAAVLSAGQRITVRSVIPGAPAAAAGLTAGDTVVAINQTTLLGKSSDQASSLLLSAGAKEVSVLRSSRTKTFHLEPQMICDCPASVIQSDAVNAYADGSKIMVTSGMLNFATNDDELAVVVGHEMAHNNLGHISKRRFNSFLGSLVDVAVQTKTGLDTGGLAGNIGSMVFSKEFEGEADYEGAYLAARAGFDVMEAPRLWRRMAKEHPNAGRSTFFSSHPTNPERFVALDLIAHEINGKKARAITLVPDRKNVTNR